MNALHFTTQSRSSLGIIQGLDLISNQKKNNINYALNADVIFVSDIVQSQNINFFNKNKLWRKIIHYDYRDTNFLEYEIIENCLKSFKRSVLQRDSDKVINDFSKIEHISHCALNEYYLYSHYEKKYDIGCFFDISDIKHLGIRRFNLIDTLLCCKIKNSLIGTSTGKKQKARLAIFSNDFFNEFYTFLKLQSACKIIFTAQPSHCEGDNRTWEAMASGGLVFMDKMFPHYKYPLIDEKHCIFYDALNRNSILEAYDKAKYYLKNNEKRIKIAKEGFEYVKKYHRPINRVKQMIRCFKLFA